MPTARVLTLAVGDSLRYSVYLTGRGVDVGARLAAESITAGLSRRDAVSE